MFRAVSPHLVVLQMKGVVTERNCFPVFKRSGFASTDPHSLLESGWDPSCQDPTRVFQSRQSAQLGTFGPKMIALFSHFILRVSVFLLNPLETPQPALRLSQG